jgi:hypothetical protein
MSTETTSSVPTTTINPSTVPYLEEIKEGQFSYDDKSKNLSIALVTLAIMIVIIFFIFALYHIYSKKSLYKSKYRYTFPILETIIIVPYIIIYALLIVHYKKLETDSDTPNSPEFCNNNKNYCTTLSLNKDVYTKRIGSLGFVGGFSLLCIIVILFLSIIVVIEYKNKSFGF